MRVYYEILGLEENASDQEIRQAFRRLALKYHPAVNKDPEAEERFKEIYEAYQALLAVAKPSRQKAKRELTCDICVGTGEIISLWTQVPGGETLRCFMCLGSGKEPTPSRERNHTPLNCRCENCNRRWAEWKRQSRPSSPRSGGAVAESEKSLGESERSTSDARVATGTGIPTPSPARRSHSGSGGLYIAIAILIAIAVLFVALFFSNRLNSDPVATFTPVSVATNIETSTPTQTPTHTLPIATATHTPTSIPTDTPTPLPSDTSVSLSTDIPVSTNTPAPTPISTSTPANTPVPTATPTLSPTPTPTNTPVPTATPTLSPTPTYTSTPVPTATPTLTTTPTNTPTPIPTATPTHTPSPTPTNTPVPVVRLALDAESTVVGYWSDGTADVEVTATLRNDGTLRLDRAQDVTATCIAEGDERRACREEASLSLQDGFAPNSESFSLRLPMGMTTVTFDYGGAESLTFDVEVPERILGVDRDVWECYADRPQERTEIEGELFDGCGGWRH